MTLTVDTKQIEKSFDKIKIRTDNSKVLLNKIALFHLRQTARTFKVQGNRDEHPAWASFSPNYKIRPSGKKVTANSKLLQDTGTLRNSFQKQLLENKRVIYGSILSYAGKHQYGDGKLPAREMLFYTKQDEISIGEIVNDHIAEEVLGK